MTHTTHYRVSINNKDKIVLLDKPLDEAPFFKNPREYCQEEDETIKALIHWDNIRDELYFRNYKDASRFFNYLKVTVPKYVEFFNVFSWQNLFKIVIIYLQISISVKLATPSSTSNGNSLYY